LGFEKTMKRRAKAFLSNALAFLMRSTRQPRENLRRVVAHASLSADLPSRLPASVVVLGPISIFGTRNIRFGEDVLLYPGLHLETQGEATIEVGEGVVISRGTHIVAMEGVIVGEGSMIGEYTSIRDANHSREEGQTIRDSAHTAKPIVIGKEVWIGRGVSVLGGVTIGDRATVGANAVVTKDVRSGDTVVGIPASPLIRKKIFEAHS
jgi:acetyltransferase-like isoleucine patch superfamily enzyme